MNNLNDLINEKENFFNVDDYIDVEFVYCSINTKKV